MAKRFIALVALIVLSGCGFDEVEARRTCDQANHGDQAKAEECFKAAKLDYDKKRLEAYQRGREIKN
jgi:hypothetical protein